MCTVSFIPSPGHFFFTSSRDEHRERAIALLPGWHAVNGVQVLFPRDPKGGGSWIALTAAGNVAILLNGALKAHQQELPYRKSRGLILLEIASSESLLKAFDQIDLSGIEPFTVILFEDRHLYSAKWDGVMKWQETLNAQRPHIWSSVTLYDTRIARQRESWFHKWLEKNQYPGTLDIIRFHQKAGDGEPENNILMQRASGHRTTSISSIRISSASANFRYLDLNSGETSNYDLSFQNSVGLQ